MDSFNLFKALKPIVNFHLEKLTITIRIGVDLSGVQDMVFGQHFYSAGRMFVRASEEMSITFHVEDLIISAAVLVAIDKYKIGNLQLRSVIESKNLIPCVLSIMLKLDMTQSLVSIGSLGRIRINGFLSDEMNNAIYLSSHLLFQSYKDALYKAIPVFF